MIKKTGPTAMHAAPHKPAQALQQEQGQRAASSHARQRETLTKLSERVQLLRQERGLSLEDLSASSGISASFLSQLERGIGNPSFVTLTKIAQALSVPISDLFGQDRPTSDGIVRANKRKRLIPPNADLVYELITPDLNRTFEVCRLEVSPGTTEYDFPYLHPGEECVLVMEGELDFHLGDELHRLGPGDSITFPGTIPHWASNPGRKKTEVIFVVVPPSF